MLARAAPGCGDDDPQSGLAELVPPDVPLYAEMTVRPEGEQADAVESLTGRIAALEDPGAAIVSELEGAFADEGVEIEFESDIEPWLGRRAGLFVRSFEAGKDGDPELAVLVEIEDQEAAEDFLARLSEEDSTVETRTYGEREYFYGDGFAAGTVEDTLVVGTEASYKVSADAIEGESLAESDEYLDRVEALGDDPLATVFLDPGSVIEAAIASEDLSRRDAEMIRPLLAEQLSAPAAVALSVAEEAASLDLVTTVDDDQVLTAEPGLVDRLPAGSWLALGLTDLGPVAQRTLDELENSGLPGAGSLRDAVRRRTGLDLDQDVASWLGDVSAFVEGTSPLGFSAGLIAETADAEAPRALLDALRRTIEREAPEIPIGPAPEGSALGFSIGLPGGLPGGGEVGVVDGNVVAAVGAPIGDVLEPDESLGDDERFEVAAETLDGEFEPMLYVDLPSLLTVAELGGAGSDPGYAAAAPVLGALGYAIAGVTAEDGLASVRITVGLDSE